ncbi:MAG: ribonuclease E/G, partial [Nitrospinae bacterium]|nr:ribonuclease E/G [Nitrospinota bacterium]
RGPDMVVRTVRDHYTADIQEILIDNHQSYKSIKEFFKLVMPRMQSRVKLYQDTKPLFSLYNIEDQIESIYNRRVPLPTGGSLVFDTGEAMVAIDVNSGKTTGASELEETAARTNIEAATEIGRQLRLRDLGGLIVIDFIDMFQKKNKSLVEKELRLAFKQDKARVNISRISKFGLVEMSRQRMSSPVKEGVFERCRSCGGAGYVKSQTAIVLSVLRKIQEYIAGGKVKVLAVQVSTEIGDYLLNNKLKYLMGLQDKHNLKIQFSCKDGLPHESFTYTVAERREERAPEVKPREEPEFKEEPLEDESFAESGEEAPSPAVAETRTAPLTPGRFVEVRALANRAAAPHSPAEYRPYEGGPLTETAGGAAETKAGPANERPARRDRRDSRRKGDPRKRFGRRMPGRRPAQNRGRRWRSNKPGQPGAESKGDSPEAVPQEHGNNNSFASPDSGRAAETRPSAPPEDQERSRPQPFAENSSDQDFRGNAGN